ncbi:hypothetical protein LguiB_035171 [Lonicera macranthoides]
MWQVLLAATAAAGFFAKRLRNTKDGDAISASEQIHEKCEDKFSSPPSDRSNDKTEIQSSRFDDESIFRFSSTPGHRLGSRKKLGYYGSRGTSRVDMDKKRGVVNSGEKFGEDHHHRKSGKRFAVCLKKRRTSRNSTAYSESKDSPSFGWGLGVGIMYMMSAGKAEISRLNTVMDETAKVVQELKSEIAKRKSYRKLHVLSSKAEGNTHSEKIGGKSIQPVIPKSNTENFDEVECPSSVLSEEPQLEELEMYQLEAELESELQKLPLCTSETSCGEEGTSYNLKKEVPAEEFYERKCQNSESDQYVGVKPTELDQKLCHLLIEQQEGQIVDLESELQQTHSRLHEKEAELQALKDCVRRLTQVSLASASDEETEAQTGDGVYGKIGTESKKSMIGIKRTMDFESYG